MPLSVIPAVLPTPLLEVRREQVAWFWSSVRLGSSWGHIDACKYVDKQSVLNVG